MAIYRLTLFGDLYGATVLNVFFFRKADGSASDMSLLCTRFRDNFLNDWRGLVINNCHWSKVKVDHLDSFTPFPSVELTFSLAGGGGFTNEMTPIKCFVIRTFTDFGGRRGRGRKYWPGATDNGLAAGLFQAIVINNWTTALGNTLTKWGGATPTQAFNWGLVSRDDLFTFRAITHANLRPSLGVQRRRNIGVGD